MVVPNMFHTLRISARTRVLSNDFKRAITYRSENVRLSLLMNCIRYTYVIYTHLGKI